MLYKALVTNKCTKQLETVESEYNTKAEFIKDLRRNGYSVDPYKVKKAEEFDRIINETNCYKWDWNPNIGK